MELRNIGCEVGGGGTSSRLCPAASFGIGGVELIGFATMVLVSLLNITYPFE
jgi:hypothetical protein